MKPEAWDWTRLVVDHLDLHARDFRRSVLFYETVLTPLGIPKLYEHDGEACFTHVNVAAKATTDHWTAPLLRRAIAG